MNLEERRRELVRKADSAQKIGDYEMMKYYDAEIKKIDNMLYGGVKKMEKREERLWIVPSNDLEAKTIIEMLERNGEKYLVTGQGWGASWDGLEDEIKSVIEESKESGVSIYGVELTGNPEGTKNIDHHRYSVTYDTGIPDIDEKTGEQKREWNGNLLFVDDRTNEQASIEQVAEILGVELTIDEKFVAANDKGFIPAMEKLGEEFGITGKDLQEIISNIRMRERVIQKITMEQEAQAEEAVAALGEIDKKQEYILVDNLPHSKAATITDRLYGKYENLLITSTDGETNFFGKTLIIEMLNEKFPGGWSGGQLEQGNGYWGIPNGDQEAIKKAVEEIITKEQNKTNDDRDDKEFNQ